jgi:hypothetical protein
MLNRLATAAASSAAAGSKVANLALKTRALGHATVAVDMHALLIESNACVAGPR